VSSPRAGRLLTVGVVVVTLAWSAAGTAGATPPGPGVRCLLFVTAREATVTGTVQVTIPDLMIDAEATGERGELRHVTGICPPLRG
jgi:hypothetical protein